MSEGQVTSKQKGRRKEEEWIGFRFELHRISWLTGVWRQWNMRHLYTGASAPAVAGRTNGRRTCVNVHRSLGLVGSSSSSQFHLGPPTFLFLAVDYFFKINQCNDFNNDVATCAFVSAYWFTRSILIIVFSPLNCLQQFVVIFPSEFETGNVSKTVNECAINDESRFRKRCDPTGGYYQLISPADRCRCCCCCCL